MKFQFTENSKIPVLSWISTIDIDRKEIIIEHGSHVETGKSYLVEGGWDDTFKNMDFDKSVFFLGSGLKLENDKIIISTSTHTYDRILLIEKGNRKYFSNSIPFLLKRTGCDLSENVYEYEQYFSSILDGLDRYQKDIPLKDGVFLQVYYCCNIIIDNAFNITIENKNNDISFLNFTDYKEKLSNSLKLLKENVTSPDRRIKYGFVTTISKGYDSAACAAFARTSVGCDIAVTFNQPEKHKEDSGKEVAAYLGYNTIIEKNANEFLNNQDLIETEFISSGELGSDISLSVFANEFKNNVVFIGQGGGIIWSLKSKNVNNRFRFEDELFTSTSLIENRLKTGFINCPLALFGACKWTEIDRISRSEEMKPFSIGGNYDRPIPRRVLEELGVPREAFGFKKQGAGITYRYDNKARIKRRISPYTFQKFNKEYKTKINLKKILGITRFVYHNRAYYLKYLFSKFHINYRLRKTIDRSSNPGAPRELFLWSMMKMKDRY